MFASLLPADEQQMGRTRREERDWGLQVSPPRRLYRFRDLETPLFFFLEISLLRHDCMHHEPSMKRI